MARPPARRHLHQAATAGLIVSRPVIVAVAVRRRWQARSHPGVATGPSEAETFWTILRHPRRSWAARRADPNRPTTTRACAPPRGGCRTPRTRRRPRSLDEERAGACACQAANGGGSHAEDVSSRSQGQADAQWDVVSRAQGEATELGPPRTPPRGRAGRQSRGASWSQIIVDKPRLSASDLVIRSPDAGGPRNDVIVRRCRRLMLQTNDGRAPHEIGETEAADSIRNRQTAGRGRLRASSLSEDIRRAPTPRPGHDRPGLFDRKIAAACASHQRAQQLLGTSIAARFIRLSTARSVRLSGLFTNGEGFGIVGVPARQGGRFSMSPAAQRMRRSSSARGHVVVGAEDVEVAGLEPLQHEVGGLLRRSRRRRASRRGHGRSGR